MGGGVPQPFKTKMLGPVKTEMEGIPDTYHLHLEELPTIRLSVEELPEIRISSDPIEIRLTEVPSTRTHLPADFRMGLSVLGMEISAVRLCGEAQMITEPYEPNPCEVCGPGAYPQPTLTSVHQSEVREADDRGAEE